MRLTILALIFYAGTTALCQSASPVPASPDNAQQNSHIFNWSGTDFSTLPPVWHRSSVLPQPMIVLPNGGPLRPNDRAKIDPQMIIHPPKSSLGLQPPGTLVAQNEYPGLQFLPIESSKKKMENIPTTWPNLKLQPIPILWPKSRLLPVGNHAPITASAPAN
jgi:hypothetical protein